MKWRYNKIKNIFKQFSFEFDKIFHPFQRKEKKKWRYNKIKL